MHFRLGITPSWRFNTSVILLVWMIVLLRVIALPWPTIGLACVAILLLAGLVSARVLYGLLRRSRWIILAIVLLFGWMTPGMPVSWIPGATSEGLQQAGEQLARLLLSIAMVSVLLSRLGQTSLLSGCYGLALPLRWLGINVDRLVLRLALTLRQLELGSEPDVAPPVFHLSRETLRLPDVFLLGLLVLVVVWSIGVNWL
jgi:energy-coupling factor transporter transmembrane protein EcfT